MTPLTKMQLKEHVSKKKSTKKNKQTNKKEHVSQGGSSKGPRTSMDLN